MNVITCVFTESLENYLGLSFLGKKTLLYHFILSHSVPWGGGAKGESKIDIFDLIVRVKQSASFLFYSAQFFT